MNETNPNTCPQCGKPLPADAPEGLCPNCVMAMNLATETQMSTADAAAAKAPPSPEEMAQRFPNFEIIAYLGRGGMGVVYKARQKALDREVAIKVLAGEWQDDPEFAKRFEREAKTLAQMSHPNIVTVHDFGQAGGLYYIVMEYVDGVNLRDLLSDGKMEPEQGLAIVPPICEALEYAHGKGVVHRDIKPENVLLDRDGQVKIADFGIASLVGSTTDISGTPSYMAPEQLSGNVDRRADIYALGVVLYEMLTGERPDKDVVAPSRKLEVDVKIDEMVLRALEKEPERRYQTAREFQTTAELVMTSTTSARQENTAPTVTQIPQSDWQSPDSGWGWFIGKLFGVTFTSPTAYKVANLSALGFLGFLGFLGNFPLPGAELMFGLYGLFGLFGLIGVAFMIELPHRMHDGHGPESDSLDAPPAGDSTGPWPQRILWLLASIVVSPPLVLLAIAVAGVATGLGIDNVELTLWQTGVAVLVILAFAPPVMFLLSLRRHPADAPDPWPRRIVLLVCAVPAVMLGLSILLLVPYMWTTQSDGELPKTPAEEARVSADPQPDAFLGRWLWEEERSADRVWVTIAETGSGSMQGTDLNGQIQFHTQFKWTVNEGRLEIAFGAEKVTGELTQDASSLLMVVTKDERSVLLQRSDKAPPAIDTDLIVIEDLALHMIVAIREKDDEKLKSLATDRIKGWPDAVSVFAVELRERYRQLVGDEEFDLRPTASMVKGDLGVVRCTGPDVLEGKCLVLSFAKTPDGWKNCLLRNSTEDVELREHLLELEHQLDAAQSSKGEE